MIAVLIPFFNPCGYQRLKQNAEICVSQLVSQGTPLILFIEVVYVGNALKFIIPTTSPQLPSNVERLRIPCNSIMFHKESLLQAGFKHICEKYKDIDKFVTLDADILFENDNWHYIVSQDLNTFEVLQPFSNAKFLDLNGNVQNEKCGWMKSFIENPLDKKTTLFEAHCGFAAAYKKSFLEKRNGFFTLCVQGGGDEIHMRAAANFKDIPERFKYIKKELQEYFNFEEHCHQKSYSNLIVRHLFHGELKKRNYNERHKNLIKNGFKGKKDLICYFANNKIIEFQDTLKWNKFFFEYFQSRNEDDGITTNLFSKMNYITTNELLSKQRIKNNNYLENKSFVNDSIDNENESQQNQESKKDIISCVSFTGCFSITHSSALFIVNENDILVDVRTGLFNRLRVLFAAKWEIKNLKSSNLLNAKKIWLHWPLNEECSVPYEKLCDDEIFIIKVKNEKQCLDIARKIKLNRVFGELRPDKKAPGPFTVLKSLECKTIPDNFSAIMQCFNPTKKLKNNVLEMIQNILPPKPWIGLHIRRLDSIALAKKLNKDISEPQDYLNFINNKLNPNLSTILLSTDDEEIVAWLKYKLEGTNKKLIILSDPSKQKLVHTSYGIRRDCGINMVRDAILLSLCDEFMGTNCSSVSEMIQFWIKSDTFKKQFHLS